MIAPIKVRKYNNINPLFGLREGEGIASQLRVPARLVHALSPNVLRPAVNTKQSFRAVG